MLKNYLKITIRHLFKHKMNAVINIFGLAVGIAAAVMILLYARNELTYDAFHRNAENIYLVYKERPTPTGTQLTYDTWLPMAEALKADYPAIQNTARLWDSDEWVEYEDKKFEENVTYADPALLNIFTLPLVRGEKESAFPDIHSALISQEIARKYFAENDPIGKTLRIDFETEYTVRGVLADIPRNSSLQIDIMVRPESVPWYERNLDNWGGSWLNTFVQLDPQTRPTALEAQFPAFVTKTWGEAENRGLNLKLLPLLNLYDQMTGARAYAYILLIIAAVILLIASINFMNLSTARSIERAKEIGMRKVLGAERARLIRQFLSEAVLMSLLALALALVLVEIILPFFNRLYEMSLRLDYLNDAMALLFLIALGVLVGLISGVYPAFYLSRFKPGEALRGQLKNTPGGIKLRLGLVVTQFMLSIVLIIATAMLWKQLQFMKSANLNFDKENVLAIRAELSDFADREAAKQTLETFENELRQYSAVKSVSSSSHIPGRWPGAFTFVFPVQEGEPQRYRMRYCAVDAHYFETYGMAFSEGRSFSEELPAEAEESVIINEAALRSFGWPEGKDHQVRLGKRVFNVIGVVKDYYYQSLASDIAPVIHFYRPPESSRHNFISVKLTTGDPAPALDFIREKWQQLAPTNPLDFFFVDENFNRLYASEDRLLTVAGGFSLLGIIIACLGLFALASLMILQRTKEIGVRKTLGASTGNIILMFSKQFLRLVVIAYIIALPAAYYASNYLLQDFAYRTELSWQIFAVAALLTIAVAWLAVGFQAIKAALANPVEALRYE